MDTTESRWLTASMGEWYRIVAILRAEGQHWLAGWVALQLVEPFAHYPLGQAAAALRPRERSQDAALLAAHARTVNRAEDAA